MTGEKPSQFERNRNNEEYRKKALEATRRWREKNKDTPEYKAKRKEKAARYYEKNRRKILLKQKAAYAKKSPEDIRDKWLKRKYGISLEQFNLMFEEQGYVCAACGGDEPTGDRGWHVDHCHTTSKVRGILCGLCNVGIGHCRESVDVLKGWVAYLEKHRGLP